jgi:hypothetical protein
MKRPDTDQMKYALAMAKGGLYSAVDQGAQNIKRKEGPGQAFLNELMKQPNVKKEELEDRGLTALAQTPKMTKEQMLQALQVHQAPQIQERILKEEEPNYQDLRDLAHEIYHRENGLRRNIDFQDALEQAREILIDEQDETTKPHYKSYTLPGGENYREMLLHLPQDRLNPQNNFKSSHYGVPNILAHMRLKDRTGPNGEKLLHLEELQSDWHQKGRDEGYKVEKNLELPEGTKIFSPHDSDSPGKIQDVFTVQLPRPVNGRDLFYGLNEAAALASARGFISRPSLSAVPNGPFKNNWHEMALKHLINHAAQNGYQGIVVTPGQEQADRYNLERHIGAIRYQPSHKLLEAFNPQGISVLSKIAEPHELPDYIGKDVADRLIKSEPKQGVHKLLGLDLRSGGEGMREFYDKKVPNTLNKLGKKYGIETRLNDQKIQTGKEYKRNFRGDITHLEIPTYAQLHHFPITEEMRQDVLNQGQPMYDHGGIVHKASGGTTHSVTPTMAQMRMALLRTNPLNIQSFGADNAPGMNPKAYVPPDVQQGVMPPPGGADLPIGGIDTDPTQAGQQLMPQQPQGVPPSPAGVAGQPAPQGLQGQSNPLQQPPSNILQMTPQGRALGAMQPPQPPMPTQGMKKGGEVHPDVWTMLYHLIMQGKHK